MPVTRRSARNDEVHEECNEFDGDGEDDYGCDDSDDNISDGGGGESNVANLSDDAIFGAVKKMLCNTLRQVLTPGVASAIGTSSLNANNSARSDSHDAKMKKTFTRCSSSYYYEILEGMGRVRRNVVSRYGFGTLLLFDRCAIPIPFARWICDNVQVQSSDIVVKNKSIPFSAHTVHDVLGLPIGGREIRKADDEKGKCAFLKNFEKSSLPPVKYFGDLLLSKEPMSDDDVVRSFLIVALSCFLCPNSSLLPSTQYLLPPVDVESAKDWDWCGFIHSWVLKQIGKYHKLKKDHSQITIGGCLYFLCVVYLDFLLFGQHKIPQDLPRISVWKRGMIKEFSALDCVEGHKYGKRPILPLKSTCYGKHTGASTPSPTCNDSGYSFKKHLDESVCGSLSPQTLNDITEVYVKHSVSCGEEPASNVENAIVEVIKYFYDRAKESKEGEGSEPNINPSTSKAACSDDYDIRQTDFVPERDDFADDEIDDEGAPPIVDGITKDACCSGDTELAPSSAAEISSVGVSCTQPQPDLIPADTNNGIVSSQGNKNCGEKKRVSVSPVICNTIGSRVRLRRSSLSPECNVAVAIENPESMLRKKRKCTVRTKQADDVEEVCVASQGGSMAPEEGCLSKDGNDSIAERASAGCTLNSDVDKCLDASKISSNSASFDHLLKSDAPMHDSQTLHAQRSKSNPTFRERMRLLDGTSPCFKLLQESDDDSCLPTQQNVVDKETGDENLSTSGVQSSSVKSFLNFEDVNSTGVCPGDAEGCGGGVDFASEESNESVGGISETTSKLSPNKKVDSTGMCSSPYVHTPQVPVDKVPSCFDKFMMVGGILGSSSKGEVPRRRRRVPRPNSYLKDFETNVCNARYMVSTDEIHAYDTLLFYVDLPEYADKAVVNVGNVSCTIGELATLRRSDRCQVHHHVINLYSRMLCNERKPSVSFKHYMFSPVGDYLMNRGGRKVFTTYLINNCKKVFQAANALYDFKISDYLFFPILYKDHWFLFVVAVRDGYFVFLDSVFTEVDDYQKEVRAVLIPNFIKAWDDFIGTECNFHEFVIHYAAVPRQIEGPFFSGYDDVIFVMKYLELWDPYINMTDKFSAKNIPDIRLQYISRIVFSPQNQLNDAKNLIRDYKKVVYLREVLENKK